MSLRHRYILPIVAIGTLGACGVERGDGQFEEQLITDAGTTSDAGFPLNDVGVGEGEGAGTMSGTWLLAAQGSTCVLSAEQVTQSYYILEIVQNDRVLTENRRLCEQQYSPLLGLRIVLSDAAREGIEFRTLNPGLVSDLRVGGSYSSGTEAALWGLDLDDPLNDEIPDDPLDPRVLDADNDGNPGITFGFEGSTCERYTAQRQLFRYDGEFVAPNDIRGTTVNVTDIEVYGSSQTLCGVAPPVRSNDAFSEFRMVRIDGLGGSTNADLNGDGEVECDEIEPLIEDVIPVREAIDLNCERE